MVVYVIFSIACSTVCSQQMDLIGGYLNHELSLFAHTNLVLACFVFSPLTPPQSAQQ